MAACSRIRRRPTHPHNHWVTGDPVCARILHLEEVLHAPSGARVRGVRRAGEARRVVGPRGLHRLPASTSTFATEGGTASRCSRRTERRSTCAGSIREVDPPRRLVYTFEWEEPDPDDQETVVTLSFLDDREGTKLVLDQGPFATEARHALHEAGWTETLERLERFLA